MAKKVRRHRRRRHHAARRRNYRRRMNPMFALAPRRHTRRRVHHRRHHRRRNPGLASFTSGGMLQTVGGAAIGFFGSNALPALVPFLAQYNTGVQGYLVQAGSGLVLSLAAGRFLGKPWRTGVLIGTGLSLLLRMVKDHSASTGSTTSAAMSGDLAGLGYYVDDRFPFAQGPGGPYANFPGNPSLANPPFPATSAAAVRAGAAAAAAALPAPRMSGIGTGRWGVNSAGDASRWN